jgi:hypothetical protein
VSASIKWFVAYTHATGWCPIFQVEQTEVPQQKPGN